MATNPHPQSQSPFAGAGLGQALGLAQGVPGHPSAQLASSAWATPAQSQAAAQQSLLWQQAQQARNFRPPTPPPPKWVIAGREMTLEQFVDAIWPDPESAERSWFLLKYSNREP
jgi:hypothetical protein